MKLVLIKNITYNGNPFPSMTGAGETGEYVEVSQWIDANFPPLEDETVLQSHANALRRQIEEVKTEALEKVDRLQTKLQEILAITHQE